MECFFIVLAAVVLFLIAAYAVGYSVAGWVVRPLERAAEQEDETVIHVEVDTLIINIEGEDEESFEDQESRE